MIVARTRVIFMSFGVLGVMLALAGTSGQGQIKAKRRTTDPPTMPQGKLGQDLFLAIDHRNTNEVRSLLKDGADANARNGLEFTPLHIAAASYQPDVVDALLSAGAVADAESSYGSPLMFAAASGNLGTAKTLLAKGAKVNTSRLDGTTVLMMAAQSPNPGFVAELIQRKANVNATNFSGATALMYAVRARNLAAEKLLLDAGAKVNVADESGQTPLMLAAMTGNADAAELLLEKGADVNARDAHKRTPLILATSFGDYPEVVKILTESPWRANIKAVDEFGESAAALAQVRGFSRSAALLGQPSASALKAIAPPRPEKSAIALSLKSLERSMSSFSAKTACVSCHQEGLGRMVTGAAAGRGFKLDQEVVKDQMERINGGLNALKPLHLAALQSPEAMKQVPLIEMNEVSTIDGWLLSGLAAHKAPTTAATGAMTMVLARQQRPTGAWNFSLPRVPMQSSPITFTALAVRGLRTYAPKANAAEIEERIGKARTWLQAAEPKTSDDMSFKVLGMKWSGAPEDDIRVAAQKILGAQNPDGGWSQMPTLPSDAYATGQAVYALRSAGLSATDPQVANGIRYLLRTQQRDGTWFVSKRAIPANNYFDADFPYGESQYASFNGSCWATLALLESLPAH